MQRLLMFTDAYPYSTTEDWKRLELEVLRKRFDEVFVAPLRGFSPHIAPDFPSGVGVLPPVFGASEKPEGSIRRLAGALLRLRRHFEPYDAGLNPARLRAFLSAAGAVDAVLESETYGRIRKLLPGSRLYFFWGRGYAELIPYLERSCRAASLVRLHRYDLYAETSSGYLPYQCKILRDAGAVGSVSRHGQRYLSEKYPASARKIMFLPLGTQLEDISSASTDGALRIVSCSQLTPVKRVPLIAEALKQVKHRVEWLHIGDGPGLQALQPMIADLPSHVRAKFAGRLMPSEVPRLYASGSFDLFLNVSESEGLPVSIMEAMAAEIPVLATDVGGTSELVDEEAGGLLEVNFAPAELARRIDQFAGLDQSAREKMRKLCRQRVAERYDIRRNAERVAECLLKLPVCASALP
jgi:colanic acid/amylovoran biosynthesis glycosyltransferase